MQFRGLFLVTRVSGGRGWYMYVGNYSFMFDILVCFDNCEECDDEVECLTCYDGYRGVLDVNGIATTCISKFPKPPNT